MFREREVPDLELKVVALGATQPSDPFLPLASTGPGADEIDAPAVRLNKQVGPQRSALGLEALWVLPETQKHLLDHFLPRVAVAGHPPR